MGIVNVTPDSFSDGGEFFETALAIAHGLALRDEGAAIVDVGGESTRPGAAAIDAESEIERVAPVVKGLTEAGATVSIDTSKAAVAAVAIDSGAAIVNDISALNDPAMAPLCAERRVGLVLMHMQGSPRTMQRDPSYRDVVTEVHDFLADRVERALLAGVGGDRIWVDPGIGFGKLLEHNLALLRNLDQFAGLGCGVLVGTSRKSFIGAISGVEDAADRLGGTIASNVLAAAAGAAILRVHDVAAHREALSIASAVRSAPSGRHPTG